jgi:hypothetical protein
VVQQTEDAKGGGADLVQRGVSARGGGGKGHIVAVRRRRRRRRRRQLHLGEFVRVAREILKVLEYHGPHHDLVGDLGRNSPIVA